MSCGLRSQIFRKSKASQRITDRYRRFAMPLSEVADWNTENPFVDVFRLSRLWISQKADEKNR